MKIGHQCDLALLGWVAQMGRVRLVGFAFAVRLLVRVGWVVLVVVGSLGRLDWVRLGWLAVGLGFGLECWVGLVKKVFALGF